MCNFQADGTGRFCLLLLCQVQVNARSIPKASVIRTGSEGKVIVKKGGCICFFNSETVK